VDGSGTAVSDRPPQASSKVDNSYGKSGKREDDPSQSTACRNAKVSHQNAQGQVENARDQLRREQRDLENVKRAMEEIRAGQAQTLTDAILEELIKRILFSLGLAGKIAYIIREGIKYIDTKQTMSNLRHYRRTLESAIEEWENKVTTHKEEVEKARERMLIHCGRDVLPEELDKIGRRLGATTAEA
jgi:molecular chaperone GrpE (heat shock protein)